RNRRIAIVIDNATWHSELTEYSKPVKRSMRKKTDNRMIGKSSN
ncbi:unnamed protein product, partial [Rotaria sp. Silwood2]